MGDAKVWAQSCCGAAVRTIGRSVGGRELLAFHAGDDSPKQLLVQAGIHAREYLTTDAALIQLEYALAHTDEFDGGIWFVPSVNPDGAELCRRGAGAVPDRAEFLRTVNGGDDFSLWKANANAVDLNVNFPADWGKGRGNVFCPAPSSYVGPCPLSEPETRALAEFTQRVRPFATVSLHSKGRVVYWDYGQTGEAREAARRFAESASSVTGYPMPEGTGGSTGGYKDWCAAALGLPGITVELFDDRYAHPVPEAALTEEASRFRTLAVELMRTEA